MGQAAFPSFVPRCPRLFAPLVLAILLLAAPANSLGETPSSPGCNTDAMIVFDASGSMAGMGFGEKSITRIEQVRRALAEVVPAVAPVRNLGLVVFGPGARPVCENVDLRFPPGPDRGERIMAEVYGLQPYGQTPLTSAVDAAAEALDFRNRPAVIVLVTDGEETCRGDPCELAHRLRSQGLNVTVHVIGYMLRLANEPPGGRFARCLSEGTSGMFISTESTEELIEALQKTLTCPMVSLTQGVVAGR